MEEKKLSNASNPLAEKATASLFSDAFSWITVPLDVKKIHKAKAVDDVLRYKSDYEEYKKIEKVNVTIEQMFDIIAFSKNEQSASEKSSVSGFRLFYRNFIKTHMEQNKGEATLKELSAAAGQAWSQLKEEEKNDYRQKKTSIEQS